MDTSRFRLHHRLLLAVALAGAGCATARSSAVPGGASLVLAAPDGTASTLDDLRRDRDATVLAFWSATCPCVRRYQERVDALLDEYPGTRVRVVGVSSNAGERFADALRVAKERGVRIPILRDEGGRVAEALGVRSTPTVVVLDASGSVRYLGWVDNERLPGDPGREPWLERALRGVLDGRSAFAARTPTYGCVITRSLFNPEQSSCCSAH
jgi:peroxiredoxin